MPVGFYNQTFTTRHLSDLTTGYADIVWDLQCASHCKPSPAVRSLFKNKTKHFLTPHLSWPAEGLGKGKKVTRVLPHKWT
jgi:hypothetical protein